ncbi:hypothetical protein FKM82_027668 [Ascaphus truei]
MLVMRDAGVVPGVGGRYTNEFPDYACTLEQVAWEAEGRLGFKPGVFLRLPCGWLGEEQAGLLPDLY